MSNLFGIYRRCPAPDCELHHEGYCTDTEASKVCKAKSNKDLVEVDEDGD
jgi:hypothetical protein